MMMLNKNHHGMSKQCEHHKVEIILLRALLREKKMKEVFKFNLIYKNSHDDHNHRKNAKNLSISKESDIYDEY